MIGRQWFAACQTGYGQQTDLQTLILAKNGLIGSGGTARIVFFDELTSGTRIKKQVIVQRSSLEGLARKNVALDRPRRPHGFKNCTKSELLGPSPSHRGKGASRSEARRVRLPTPVSFLPNV